VLEGNLSISKIPVQYVLPSGTLSGTLDTLTSASSTNDGRQFITHYPYIVPATNKNFPSILYGDVNDVIYNVNTVYAHVVMFLANNKNNKSSK